MTTTPSPPDPLDDPAAGVPEIDSPEAAVASGVPSDAAAAVLADVAGEVDALEQEIDIEVLDRPRRMLLVHAHPDDETINNAATMAKYVSEHAQVTLVTCTLGEGGEIVVPDLAHMAADRDDTLGQHRVGELAAACEAIGVTDHRFLGGPGRWRDSGMMGTPDNDDPRSFWQADLAEATRELVRIVRETRPQVVVTYDENGGYGHPDHIQTHRVTMAAVDAAGDRSYAPGDGEPWLVAKVYYNAVPRSVLQAGIDLMKQQGSELFPGLESADDVPFAVDDALITAEIDGRDHFDAKIAAMRAHRSQISVDGPFFALADGVGMRAFGIEHYRLVRGDRGQGEGPHGRETDLFAGVQH
jgi:N-acetyl-1-D-myo-inositol-2-amino-2-deoxy-alpha-D-glucopyranoside deacetylase